MNISVFDLFSIGIGPSSSHTVGPMRAAKMFVDKLMEKNLFETTVRIKVDVYGSLALTGKGHGTDRAILNGLSGMSPETVIPNEVIATMQKIIQNQQIHLGQKKIIPFTVDTDLIFHQKELLPCHTNGMRFSAFAANDALLMSEVYYSIGGGFIVTEAEYGKQGTQSSIPYPFSSAQELMDICEKNKISIDELMMENEKTYTDTNTIKTKLLQIATIMDRGNAS